MTVGQSIWAILGIAPTAEVSDIRRAYAVRLKVTHPEDDPDGFKELRAAYETALRMARGRVVQVAAASQSSGESDPVAVTPSAHEPETKREPAPPVDPHLEELRRSYQALHQALASPGEGGLAAAQRALASIVKSEVLHNVNLERDVEQRLAHLLASAIPLSDSLLAMAADRFGWLSPQVALDANGAISAIRARVSDLKFLQALEAPQSPYAAAYKGLRGRKFPLWSWVLAHFHRKSRFGEYQLLHLIRIEHPALLALLNPKAIQWWDRMASRPQPSANLLLTAVLFGGLLGSISFASGEGVGLGLSAAGLFVGIMLWKWLLLEWPRYWMKKRWPVDPPLLIYLGWLPLSIGCLVASLLARGWVAALVAVLALAATQWAFIVSYLRRLPRTESAQDWLIAFMVPQLAIAMWWISSFEGFPAGSVESMMVPFFSLLIASGLAAPAVRGLWLTEFDGLQRRKVMAALALLSLAACFLLWWLTPYDTWRPLCAVIVLILVVLIRPIVFFLGDGQQKLRLGWIAALVAVLVFVSVLPPMEARGVVLVGGGIGLIATSVFSMGLELWNERQAQASRSGPRG